MSTPTEADGRTARDYWGPCCLICGAPPREPTHGERAMGIEEVSIPIHHADHDRSNNVLQNTFPLCDREDEEACACHQKVHAGTGDPVHHVFSRFLPGKVSREALELVAMEYSEEFPSLSRAEKRHVEEVLVEYGQPLSTEERQELDWVSES